MPGETEGVNATGEAVEVEVPAGRPSLRRPMLMRHQERLLPQTAEVEVRGTVLELASLASPAGLANSETEGRQEDLLIQQTPLTAQTAVLEALGVLLTEIPAEIAAMAAAAAGL